MTQTRGHIIRPPHLVKTAGSRQLVVNGKPFLMRAAEVQNSSFSSAEYMRTKWQSLVDMNINTVLGAITWEMLEPQEGTFDFVELDEIIKDARSYGMKLVLLWFGSYKNGVSTYVPDWVKSNPRRFPRAQIRQKTGIAKTADILSPFHAASVAADAAAFKTLMAHLKEFDASHSTVLMVQVENEPGCIGDSRDVSVTATQRFRKPVPSELLHFLRQDCERFHPLLKEFLQDTWSQNTWQKNESWESVFGSSPRTDELFMAFHYALYVDQVAKAGASQYSIPLYTNVWLSYSGSDEGDEWPVVAGGGAIPGGYPSGGAVTQVLDIWLRFAPNLDFIAPDIYLNNYSTTCATYAQMNSLLFIPEQRRDEHGARRIWEAFGSHYAIGTAPFGIDTTTAEACAFTRHYALLDQVSELVLEAHRRPPGTSFGFYFDDIEAVAPPQESTKVVTMCGFNLRIERAFVLGRAEPACGMIIHLGGDSSKGTFLLIGWGFQVFFTATDPKSSFTGILRFEEKLVDPKTRELRTLRVFGGDESRGGICAVMPNPDPDYGGFPICITIPANTMLAECTVYCLPGEEDMREDEGVPNGCS
ncbi:glycoside hydrolase superfamily [Pyrenochaeta sp. MPI-SDFR-AT-0127]|nr:glycoside hydrolase superfamily [Pyrenochaeta sp. MPI-SDFR-AT-0127]